MHNGQQVSQTSSAGKYSCRVQRGGFEVDGGFSDVLCCTASYWKYCANLTLLPRMANGKGSDRWSGGLGGAGMLCTGTRTCINTFPSLYDIS